ncbi:hypothetical protein Syun_006675 [Stephania yunnanensis]|uniref:HECT-type E3 ubiquitin transferase n=1 Tax=Stephania yunnanensis TaxID=152371 RepID=A0AAP0L0G2_9MAGN
MLVSLVSLVSPSLWSLRLVALVSVIGSQLSLSLLSPSLARSRLSVLSLVVVMMSDVGKLQDWNNRRQFTPHDDFHVQEAVDERFISQYGEQTEEELLPWGKDIRVTNENVVTYIHLIANHRLNFQVTETRFGSDRVVVALTKLGKMTLQQNPIPAIATEMDVLAGLPSVALSVGGWFFDRVGVSVIDCPYPWDVSTPEELLEGVQAME